MKFYGAALLALGVLHQTTALAPSGGNRAFSYVGNYNGNSAARGDVASRAVGPNGMNGEPSRTAQTGMSPPSTSQDANRVKVLEDRLKMLENQAPRTGTRSNVAPMGGQSGAYMPSRTGQNPMTYAPRRPASGLEHRRIMEKSPPVTVQGGSLKTWSYASPAVERVQVALQTEGRPLDADVDLWQGPDNTPHKMRVYCEDGCLRPFNAVIETPRGPNTIAIRNIGQLEFPLDAFVSAETGPVDYSRDFQEPPRTIQGGALRTYPFDPRVESVQVMLRTDGRPLNARIELLQGPNNNKQVIQLYTEDGMDRPFYVILETPGSGNVVRVVNAATVEFPMTAWVEPYVVGDGSIDGPVIGGDPDGFMTPGGW